MLKSSNLFTLYASIYIIFYDRFYFVKMVCFIFVTILKMPFCNDIFKTNIEFDIKSAASYKNDN